MSLLELELIHYVRTASGSKSCNKNRKERWSEGSPRPRVERTRPRGRNYSDCFSDPSYWKLDTAPCCTGMAPWSAFCKLKKQKLPVTLLSTARVRPGTAPC
ncbi:hypothetical protein HanRHA438_Chr04g0171111 [Helianthus annuus]|nr:hypothetical protein HanRHA438_Chr04g0171111 [Helianthus annuus]